MIIDELKMQQSINRCIVKMGENPTPELPITSLIYMSETLSRLYKEAFEAGYRQSEGNKIIKSME